MTYPSTIQDSSQGSLLLEQKLENTKVYFIPTKDPILEINGVENDGLKWLLLELDSSNDTLIIYPFKNWEEGVFEQKYVDLETITLKGFLFGNVDSIEDILNILSELPTAFVKDYKYGLGLKSEYICIINMFEDLHIRHLTISKKDLTKIEEEKESATMRFAEFEEMRKSLNRISGNTRSIANLLKRKSVYNHFAFYLNNEKFPQRGIAATEGLVAKLIMKTSAREILKFNKEPQKSPMETFRKRAVDMVKDHPEEIIKLRNDLELVSLEQLIQQFEIMLQKKLNEVHWQKLFNANPFILNLAFGYPIIKINEQASVGGRKISGEGDKIVDFLVKNSVSNNAALFEIKTPSTRLLNKEPYRESVYIPSSDLTGAVNQVLDQKYKFEKSIVTLKDTSRIYDLESYSVQGILIIGRSLEDHDKQKSFELYRGNLKNISIITFDEVLGKLKQLLFFLSSNEEEKRTGG